MMPSGFAATTPLEGAGGPIPRKMAGTAFLGLLKSPVAAIRSQS